MQAITQGIGSSISSLGNWAYNNPVYLTPTLRITTCVTYGVNRYLADIGTPIKKRWTNTIKI